MFDPKLKEALGRVQKPGRYTGGEPGSVYKDKEKVDVRFAFCFPDTYEVGMSFLGEKILYELLNRRENWWCERAFMPWLDMKAEMERLGLPLYTMESKDPLTAFDAVGFCSTSCPIPTFWPCWIWQASRSIPKTVTNAGR